MKTSGRQGYLPLAVVAGLAATVLMTLTVMVAARLPALVAFDRHVSHRALRLAETHPWWRAAMSALTHTGDTLPLVLAATAAFALLVWRWRWDAALYLAVAELSGVAIRLTILQLIARPRPPVRLTATPVGRSRRVTPRPPASRPASLQSSSSRCFLPVGHDDCSSRSRPAERYW